MGLTTPDRSAKDIILAGQGLSIDEVARIADGGALVRLDDDARARLDAMREEVARRAVSDEAIYGVNTGFGSLARVRIEPDHVREVQRNLIRSHAAGVGEPLPRRVVRAMMAISAASLARGRSGVRAALLDKIIELLNEDITPLVPSRGSVGASGDLAPLAHMALVLMGEGRVLHTEDDNGRSSITGAEAHCAKGIEPITLEAKEGLALINGTHLMTAIAALSLRAIDDLFEAALLAAAMAIDACRATDESLDPRLHEARGQPGQIEVAARLREHLAGSQIIPSHKVDDPRVQDPYCLRAAPQVLGAALDTVNYVRSVIERELAAVTDNPLVFPRGEGATQSYDLEFISGGNFHGMPVAIALDALKIALCHIAGIAERRINWLLTASDSENPISPHLSPQPGLHSGLMIAQYTAAACCNELQMLAAPASVANIPTSAGMEDYNSMGATSALQTMQAVELATNVVAIEFLVMAEALEYQRPLRSGDAVERAHDVVRAVVPRLTEDRPPSPDIEAIARLIRESAFRS